MVITLTHFSTYDGKIVFADEDNKIPLTEEIKSCVLEKLVKNLYPEKHQDIKYYVGSIYEGFTNKDDLTKHSDKRLILSSRDRFVFADVTEEEAKAIRTEIFDAEFYAAQYGANLMTDCSLSTIQDYSKLKILVVDGTTGESNGILPPEKGRLLVGDGDGRISAALAQQMGLDEKSQFQTRGYAKSQPENSLNQTYLIKGTLTPFEDTQGYDLILSTDQIGKGRKDKATKIKPGEYTIDVSLGATKSASRFAVSNKVVDILESSEEIPGSKQDLASKMFAQSYGKSATGAQFWNCLPEGGRGFAQKIIDDRLKELKDIQSDPRKLAWEYIRNVEEQVKTGLEREMQRELGDSGFTIDSLPNEEVDKLISEDATEKYSFYRRLKTDLENHQQILETSHIETLKEYLQEQLRDCATGRYIKFNFGMLKTNNSLSDGEIRVPHLKEGEEVLFYRSPVPNSNVIGVLKNDPLKDEEVHPGTIEMNRKTYDLLNADTDGDCPAFISRDEICSRYAKRHTDWFVEYTGNKQGYDYIYSEKLEEYKKAFDEMIAEVKYYQQSENKYAKIVTPEKSAYNYSTFEEVALAGTKNSIGLVANASMHAIALEKEIDYLPPAEKAAYLQEFAKNFAAIKLPSAYVPQELKQLIEQRKYFQNLGSNLTPEQVESGIEATRKTLRSVVEVLGQQLEIEVQSEKSANRSNPQIIEVCEDILSYRTVLPLKDRKANWAYMHSPIGSNTHTTLDGFVQATNEIFKQSELNRRTNIEFKDLFQGVEYSPDILAMHVSQNKSVKTGKIVEIRDNFNKLLRNAANFSKDVKESERDSPLWLKASVGSKELEIILDKNANKKFNLRDLQELHNVQLVRDKYNRKNFNVTASVLDDNGDIKTRLVNGKEVPERKLLGKLSSRSVNEYADLINKLSSNSGSRFIDFNPTNSKEPVVLQAKLVPMPTKTQVDAMFLQAYDYAKNVREEIPPGEREAYAAALWKVTTTSGYNAKKSNRDDQEKQGYNFNSFAASFTIFDEEVTERLKTLQFDHLKVSGLNNEQQPGNRKAEIEIVSEMRSEKLPGQTNVAIYADGKRLGFLNEESAQLPIGTKATATIKVPSPTTIVAVSTGGTSFKIGNFNKLSEYGVDERNFSLREVDIKLKYIPPPPSDGKRMKDYLVAVVDGRVLGEIKDSKKLEGLIKSRGKKVDGFEFKAKLETQQTSFADIDIDVSTVRYPDIWQKRQIDVILPLAAQDQLPTVLFEHKNHGYRIKDGVEYAPLLGVATDPTNTEKLREWLNKNSVTIHSGENIVQVEKELGYEVTLVDSRFLNEQAKYDLAVNFGKPLDASQEEYFEHLQEIIGNLNSKLGSQKQKAVNIKVISGGQTGADMGGLVGASALGLETGGTAAGGWMTEKGNNPQLAKYGLVEGSTESTIAATYNQRTITNIQDSDGTIIFGDITSSGSKLTLNAATELGKPVLHIPFKEALTDKQQAAAKIQAFIEENQIETLNVAGNRESRAPGLENSVSEIIQIALSNTQEIKIQPPAPITPKEAEQVTQSAAIRRERWEQNLINASFKALKENPENASKQIQTAPVGSRHLAVYSIEKQTLAILNPDQEVIFKVQKGQLPSIDKLTNIQKQYWDNPEAYKSQNKASKGFDYENRVSD